MRRCKENPYGVIDPITISAILGLVATAGGGILGLITKSKEASAIKEQAKALEKSAYYQTKTELIKLKQLYAQYYTKEMEMKKMQEIILGVIIFGGVLTLILTRR
jgi:hypothetical protein